MNGDYLPVLLDAAGGLLRQVLPPSRGLTDVSFWGSDNTRLILHNDYFPMTRIAPLFPGRASRACHAMGTTTPASIFRPA